MKRKMILQYLESFYAKQQKAVDDKLNPDITKLPNDFICHHFNKNMPVEDRLALTMSLGFNDGSGQLEYTLYEVERRFWRVLMKIKRQMDEVRSQDVC